MLCSRLHARRRRTFQIPEGAVRRHGLQLLPGLPTLGVDRHRQLGGAKTKALIVILVGAFWLLPSAASAQGSWWSTSQDKVFAKVDGSSASVHRDRARDNCCPDSFSDAVTISTDTLYVVETEVLTNPCACMCCCSRSATIEDLFLGEYQMVFRRWCSGNVPAGSGRACLIPPAASGP